MVARYINMADLTTLSNQLDEEKGTCRVIIETPKGCRNKFDYDPESNLFMLGGLLPEGMMFPFDFGFIPCTLGDDGDPLDILILMDAPAHVGCLIDARLIGVISAEQIEDGKKGTNDRRNDSLFRCRAWAPQRRLQKVIVSFQKSIPALPSTFLILILRVAICVDLGKTGLR